MGNQAVLQEGVRLVNRLAIRESDKYLRAHDFSEIRGGAAVLKRAA